MCDFRRFRLTYAGVIFIVFGLLVRHEQDEVHTQVRKHGTQCLELRTIVHVDVTDSAVSIDDAKSRLSHADASDFLRKLQQHRPETYDLLVVYASIVSPGGAQEFIDSLVEQNKNWKVNIIISREAPRGSVFPGVHRPISDVVDYFSKTAEWPPKSFFDDYDPSTPDRNLKKEP